MADTNTYLEFLHNVASQTSADVDNVTSSVNKVVSEVNDLEGTVLSSHTESHNNEAGSWDIPYLPYIKVGSLNGTNATKKTKYAKGDDVSSAVGAVAVGSLNSNFSSTSNDAESLVDLRLNGGYTQWALIGYRTSTVDPGAGLSGRKVLDFTTPKNPATAVSIPAEKNWLLVPKFKHSYRCSFRGSSYRPFGTEASPFYAVFDMNKSTNVEQGTLTVLGLVGDADGPGGNFSYPPTAPTLDKVADAYFDVTSNIASFAVDASDGSPEEVKMRALNEFWKQENRLNIEPRCVGVGNWEPAHRPKATEVPYELHEHKLEIPLAYGVPNGANMDYKVQVCSRLAEPLFVPPGPEHMPVIKTFFDNSPTVRTAFSKSLFGGRVVGVTDKPDRNDFKLSATGNFQSDPEFQGVDVSDCFVTFVLGDAGFNGTFDNMDRSAATAQSVPLSNITINMEKSTLKAGRWDNESNVLVPFLEICDTATITVTGDLSIYCIMNIPGQENKVFENLVPSGVLPISMFNWFSGASDASTWAWLDVSGTGYAADWVPREISATTLDLVGDTRNLFSQLSDLRTDLATKLISQETNFVVLENRVDALEVAVASLSKDLTELSIRSEEGDRASRNLVYDSLDGTLGNEESGPQQVYSTIMTINSVLAAGASALTGLPFTAAVSTIKSLLDDVVNDPSTSGSSAVQNALQSAILSERVARQASLWFSGQNANNPHNDILNQSTGSVTKGDRVRAGILVKRLGNMVDMARRLTGVVGAPSPLVKDTRQTTVEFYQRAAIGGFDALGEFVEDGLGLDTSRWTLYPKHAYVVVTSPRADGTKWKIAVSVGENGYTLIEEYARFFLLGAKRALTNRFVVFTWIETADGAFAVDPDGGNIAASKEFYDLFTTNSQRLNERLVRTAYTPYSDEAIYAILCTIQKRYGVYQPFTNNCRHAANAVMSALTEGKGPVWMVDNLAQFDFSLCFAEFRAGQLGTAGDDILAIIAEVRAAGA
jgi:hypothetical protein